ncbi:MAG TPA: COX15/CtaA family protein [Flavipsychrobacter sp.]|nr:COX15/CtaA family protein [Flavipsychrobacter sp.]
MAINKRKAVAIWLLTGVLMIMVQVLLGGVTRLTGSGLSITEWKPIMGTVPPLNDTEWNKAFEGYKQIAQYKYLNNHFTLADFKAIFFWEWFHRLWARLLGVVFVIGFVYFLVKKYFDKEMILPFIVLFIWGGVVGMIGWIMVQSGLKDTVLYVNHIKLSIHFLSALSLLCYTLWFALQLLVDKNQIIADKKLNRSILFTIALLAIQLAYGAFMAGLKAAPSAPTWPLINGDWVPAVFGTESWINHPINVQFIHRMLAYLLGTVIIFLSAALYRNARKYGSRVLRRFAICTLFLMVLQVILGIFTILLSPKMGTQYFGAYELLAEAHQLVAMLLLCALVTDLFLVRRRQLALL